MNVLVVGGGGREHAIVKALKKNPRVTKLYCCPGNGGISEDAECVNIRATDLDTLEAFAASHAVDFAVVAPDDPLVLGLADRFRAMGIPTFGPGKDAARIEGIKAFSKDLMRKYGIPTARFAVFSDPKRALAYSISQPLPIVVKANGLALGKGVLICETHEEAAGAIREMMEQDRFGASGHTIVIEEFMTGPEVSVLAFTDGKTLVPMVSSMDHKRALDGDRGPNTGGMGTVAPNPYYTPEIADYCMKNIFLPTVYAMQAEGCPFSGCLYFGLMLTPDGPKVVEYNCRFGDPETQVVLPLLESDLLEVMEAVANGRLAETEVRFSSGHAVCVVLASGGYPGKYETGKRIEGIDEASAQPGVCVYHAGTRRTGDGAYLTAGGRVLGVTAAAGTLSEAIDRAYQAAGCIRFEKKQFRSDIGRRAMQAK